MHCPIHDREHPSPSLEHRVTSGLLARPCFWQALLLSASILLGGCDDSSSPTEPEPEDVVAPDTIVESFFGELSMGQQIAHFFTVSEDGTVDLEIVALEPLATLTVGVGLATRTTDDDAVTTCSAFAEDNSIVLNEVVTSVLAAGDYCALVFDVGNIFEGITVSYELTVEHP